MKKENKDYIYGGTARYGYLKDPFNKGKLIIDPIASKYVKKIFDLYDKGYGTITIAKILNEENILKPSIYKQKFLIPNYKSNVLITERWTDKNVRLILREEMYTGNMVQGRYKKVSYKENRKIRTPKSDWYIVEGTHEPIISKEQFARVQKTISNKSRASFIGVRHLFAEKARCKMCGGRMKKLRNGSGNYYLKCCKSFSPIYECSSLNRIMYNRLINIITEEIKKKINDSCNFDNVTQRIKQMEQQQNNNKTIESEIRKAKKEIENLINAISTLYLDKVNGIITEKQFIEIKTVYQNKKENLENEIIEFEKELNRYKQNKIDNKSIKKIIEQYKNFTDLNYEIINAFIDKIFIGEKKENQEIDIHWNF